MATTFTAHDIELLGYSEPRKVSEDEQVPYAIFEAIAAAGLEKIPARFIYLKSTCTLEAARTARRYNGPIQPHTYVVKPASLRLAESRLRKIFDHSTQIFELEDLVWTQLRGVFSEYIESLAEVPTEKYFVPPRSPDRKIGDDLEVGLMDYMRGEATEDNGTLLVLSAHAGVGKTTVSDICFTIWHGMLGAQKQYLFMWKPSIGENFILIQ